MMVIGLVTIAGCSLLGKPRLPPSPDEHLAVVGSAEPPWGPAPLTVKFSVETFERDDVTEFRWSFGDGATSSKREPTHTYKKPGDYTAKVTAVSPSGMAVSDDVEVEAQSDSD